MANLQRTRRFVSFKTPLFNLLYSRSNSYLQPLAFGQNGNEHRRVGESGSAERSPMKNVRLRENLKFAKKNHELRFRTTIDQRVISFERMISKPQIQVSEAKLDQIQKNGWTAGDHLKLILLFQNKEKFFFLTFVSAILSTITFLLRMLTRASSSIVRLPKSKERQVCSSLKNNTKSLNTKCHM